MDGPTPYPTADLPDPHGGLPGSGRVRRLHPLPADLGGLHGQSGPQRPDPRRDVHRHRAGDPAGRGACFPRSAGSTPCGQAEEGIAAPNPPVLLAPHGRPSSAAARRNPTLSVAATRSLLDSIGARLDESREIVRYLAGLLVFLGLLGTFWGLIDTVGSVGRIISSLRTGQDSAVLFDELKNSLAGPLQGMGLSFSASLFGLAGSLVLGFLDLQAGQAQNRFYTELEDWLAISTMDTPAEPALRTGTPQRPGDRPQPPDRRRQRRRRRTGGDAGHGEPRRGRAGPRPAHAGRAADDPRLGRGAGRPREGAEAGARPPLP